MAEICRGYNLGPGKQLLAIKVSFHINKPSFRGLMSELVTRSLLRRPTFMTSISKNKTRISKDFQGTSKLFISAQPHGYDEIINCKPVTM